MSKIVNGSMLMSMNDQERLFIRSWIQGTLLGTAAFGGNLVFFILNFNLLWNRLKAERKSNGKYYGTTALLLVYIVFIMSLCIAVEAPEVFVTQPGHEPAKGSKDIAKSHPNGSILLIFEGTPSFIGNTASIMIQCFVSALLFWRCFVIYRNSRSNVWLLVSIPALLSVSSLVLGVVFLVTISSISETRPALPLVLVFAFAIITLSSNLVFTLMIVARLLIYHHTIKMLVGSKYASQYTSISSMFIESAAFINILVLLSLIGVRLMSPVTPLVLLSYSQIEALASFMIIYRVAKGTAWSSGTAHQLIAQNVVRNGDFNPSVPDAVRLSAMRYRVSPDMTQISTSFNFTHGAGSQNILSSSVRESGAGPAALGARSESAQ